MCFNGYCFAGGPIGGLIGIGGGPIIWPPMPIIGGLIPIIPGGIIITCDKIKLQKTVQKQNHKTSKKQNDYLPEASCPVVEAEY